MENRKALRRREELEEEVNLAAVAITLNVRLRSSDMPVYMQQRALRLTRSLLDSSSAPKTTTTTTTTSRPNPTHLARAIKKEFDLLYGPAWHCVVGTGFGSFVTHSPGGFIYFSLDDSLSVLLFKTETSIDRSMNQWRSNKPLMEVVEMVDSIRGRFDDPQPHRRLSKRLPLKIIIMEINFEASIDGSMDRWINGGHRNGRLN
ncbi:hypothetical protein Ddye_026877 [Dipteronia dyeriana]|uniref:Dynein light chain n=1 Tax=Dipteronia dyeriana TaxID=168575 RepID=A0AAD9TN06_9ROSI|nr:hypothetical protein Ddye_026877 [Dipteronia dyeriana]